MQEHSINKICFAAKYTRGERAVTDSDAQNAMAKLKYQI